MSPQKLWEKLNQFLSQSSSSKKKKTPLKHLILLLVLGIALMLISHFYTGGARMKPVTSPTVAPVTKQSGQAMKQASLLKSSGSSPNTIDEYEGYYEDQLENILNSMAGISNVKVLVTLSTGPEKVYEVNKQTTNQQTTEQDSNGGTRTTSNQTTNESLATINQGSGGNTPILITQRGPTFKAILVVANGVDHPAAQERVINAVSTVLDVPSYKVSVQERK
jgi:stage III sporulation protein AG